MQKEQNSRFNENELTHWKQRISAKLFNEGVYKENYTKEKAVKVLDRCVGSNMLIEILNHYEKDIIEILISEKEKTV